MSVSRKSNRVTTDNHNSEHVLTLQRIGHHLRKPLVQIIEQSNYVFSEGHDQLSGEARLALGKLRGEAYRMLGMYDWGLLLFEHAALSHELTPLNSRKLLVDLCLQLDHDETTKLDYKLMWCIPSTLPFVYGHYNLLYRGLQMLIILVGQKSEAKWVQLDAQAVDDMLQIQLYTDGSLKDVDEVEFETAMLKTVARMCNGSFHQEPDATQLNFVLRLPISSRTS